MILRTQKSPDVQRACLRRWVLTTGDLTYYPAGIRRRLIRSDSDWLIIRWDGGRVLATPYPGKRNPANRDGVSKGDCSLSVWQGDHNRESPTSQPPGGRGAGVSQFPDGSANPSQLGQGDHSITGGCGKSAAVVYTLIETAKINSVNPQAWLTDTLARIADHKINRIDELLAWRYAQHS